jgi:dTDP-D-glucose 4,6-dehydratase
MTKVITGGSGLIGSAFEKGVKLTSKRDLTDYDKAKFAIAMYKPDVVVHCAAKVGGVGANMQFPADFFMDNIRMNTMSCGPRYSFCMVCLFLILIAISTLGVILSTRTKETFAVINKYNKNNK